MAGVTVVRGVRVTDDTAVLLVDYVATGIDREMGGVQRRNRDKTIRVGVHHYPLGVRGTVPLLVGDPSQGPVQVCGQGGHGLPLAPLLCLTACPASLYFIKQCVHAR